MISVEEALDKVLGYFSVLNAEEKPILECLGQVLDEDVYSAIDVPPRDNSAMDGYAVRAEDVAMLLVQPLHHPSTSMLSARSRQAIYRKRRLVPTRPYAL
jgi:molybdopterin molybdotransferase